MPEQVARSSQTHGSFPAKIFLEIGRLGGDADGRGAALSNHAGQSGSRKYLSTNHPACYLNVSIYYLQSISIYCSTCYSHLNIASCSHLNIVGYSHRRMLAHFSRLLRFILPDQIAQMSQTRDAGKCCSRTRLG